LAGRRDEAIKLRKIERKFMKYLAKIDGGQGGEETFLAEDAADALAQAIEWAREGDWPHSGCTVDVTVTNEEDEDDSMYVDVEILSEEEKKEEELKSDGEGLGENEGEFDTEKIIRLGDEAYYMHPNGGGRGAHDRQCGDGVWRERPCSPTRVLTKSEARCMLLDWGYSPSDVAAKTGDLK
jgi:hypothetical protein